MDILKPKRGRHSTIARLNPILAEGEVVFEINDDGTTKWGIIKMGDGVTPYNELEPFLKSVKDYIPSAEKGARDGIAPLDSLGKIDSQYLPSYVDDVIEYDSVLDFPVQGSSGILYVDCSAVSNNVYRWSGSQYIPIAKSVLYTLLKQGSSIVLQGSDGTRSYVSNVGGVEIRPDEPSTGELYPGKMWIVKTE